MILKVVGLDKIVKRVKYRKFSILFMLTHSVTSYHPTVLHPSATKLFKKLSVLFCFHSPPFSLETTSTTTNYYYLSLSCCSIQWSLLCPGNNWAMTSTWHSWSPLPPSLCCAFFIWLGHHIQVSFKVTGFLGFLYKFLFFPRTSLVPVHFLLSVYIASLASLFQTHDFKYLLYANDALFISLNQTSLLNSRSE